MLQDAIVSQEQLSIDEIPSPLSAQIFDICDPELLRETFKNSEVTSGSNGGYEEKSLYRTSQSVPTEPDKPTTTTTTSATTTANGKNGNISVIFDPQDEFDQDISASIDFSSSPQFFPGQEHFEFNQPQPQPQPQPPAVLMSHGLSYPPPDPLAISASMGPRLTIFEEDCLSSVPSFATLNPCSPSCSFLPPASIIPNYMTGARNPAISAESSGIFPGSILLGPELQLRELDYQGDNGGLFCPDSIQQVLNPGDFQTISGESTQRLVGAGASAQAPALATEISSLDESTFNKVGKLSVEQRKEKIHRYMKKRNERNFSKKIKYACRKTLADSRPRVRGRFAKNDEFGETQRQASSHHEDDDDDEVISIFHKENSTSFARTQHQDLTSRG